MEPTEPSRPARPRPWTLGMVVLLGVVVWCVALGPVVALMSGGQISVGDGWFSLGQVVLDPSTSDAAMPGLTVMVALGGVGIAVAAIARVVAVWRARRGGGG